MNSAEFLFWVYL